MFSPEAFSSKYPESTEVKREKHKFYLDPETKKSFTSASKVLPLFEKEMYDFAIMKHYSLETNETLKYRWRKLIREMDTLPKRTPFQFPKNSDNHFYKYHNCYAPNLSTCGYTKPMRMSHKTNKFSDGNPVPIPQEMHVRKTRLNKRKQRNVAKKLEIEKITAKVGQN